MRTRIVRPVNIPVSLAKGHIRTGPFRLNLDANYWIDLDPDTDWRWDSAHPKYNPYRKLQTRWKLYENGREGGRLDEPTVLPWPSGFSAVPSVYELDVEMTSDFSCLDSIHPHLRVVASTENYEIGALFVRIGWAIGAYIGFIALTFVPVIRFAHSFEHSETVAESASLGQDFRWARKLPLRRPFSGLPGFGLVGGIIFAIIAIVMMIMTGAFVYPPRGLWARLLKPGADPQNSDAWTQPLVVLAKNAGPGQTPNLYVNSKQVAWDHFDRTLKQELGRRQKWVVYVGGDSTVPWQYVVNLIEVVRRDNATAYLITGPQNP